MLGATQFLQRSNMDPRSAEYFHQQPIKQEVIDRRSSSNSYSSRSKSKIRGVKHSADPMSPSYSSWGSSGRRPDHGTSGDEAFGIPQQYMNDPYLANMPGPSSSSLSSWNTPSQNMSITMNCSMHPGSSGHGGMSYPGNGDMQAYNSSHGQDTAMAYSGHHMSTYPNLPQSSSSGSRDEEIHRLHRRIQQLERELSQSKHTNASHHPAFQSSWRVRTEARKRIYCSLNRAGNALCAWHDSRRERRIFSPRNAPPGFLNCGCTYEEALFEESLARHGVGSYLPGDNVRMDPALRNTLLKLLERRYKYKDGDFELDPTSLNWIDGESPAVWEKKAQSGAVVKRRTDSGQ